VVGETHSNLNTSRSCLPLCSFRNYNWFWVPIVGPHIGAILGAIIYLFLVELHWDSEDELSNDFLPGDSGEIKAEDLGEKTFF